MNLQKRNCPINFEIKSCFSGILDVVLHIGNDKHDMRVSYTTGKCINALLEALGFLYPKDINNERQKNYTERNDTLSPYIATFNWEYESSTITWKIKKYPSDKTDFNVIVELIFNNNEKFSYKVNYRDLCYATAQLCTNIIKSCGFVGYVVSFQEKDIDIYDFLLIKTYALKAKELMDIKYSNNYLLCSDINEEIELLLFDMNTEPTIKKYDEIDVEILPENYCDLEYFSPGKRAKILINGIEFLDIVMKAEEKIFSSEKFLKKNRYSPMAGDYIYRTASGLLYELQNAAQLNGDNSVYLLSCSECDEPGCTSVLTDIVYTKDSIIWKNFETASRTHKFDFRYEFKISQYKKFMEKLNVDKIQKEKENQKTNPNNDISEDVNNKTPMWCICIYIVWFAICILGKIFEK